jgi:hypothetical protein
MEIITLGAFSASAQSLPLRKLTHNDSIHYFFWKFVFLKLFALLYATIVNWKLFGPVLTFTSRLLNSLPLCCQMMSGRGMPVTSHSSFNFWPTRAMTLESGVVKVGTSVGSRAVSLQVILIV